MNHGALTDSSSYDLRGKVRYVHSAALRGTAELNLSYTGLGAVSGFSNTGVAGGFPIEEFITDGLGNRVERRQSGGANDPFDPDRHRRFFYDSWNRLYEMDSPSANPLQFEHRESYQYDAAGNTRYSYVFERPSTGWELTHDASASYYGADNKLRVYNRHAGWSRWKDLPSVNDFSLGWEIANRNDCVESYTDAQYEALAEAAGHYLRQGMPLEAFVSHASVARPRGRKSDPCGFNWERLRSSAQNMLEPGRPCTSV